MKPATALAVTTDGEGTLVRVTALSHIQDAVGGWIEALPLPLDTGVTAYGNEDAKQVCVRNPHAHRLLDALGWSVYPGDYPGGTVLFFGCADLGGEDGVIEVDVPEHVLDTAAEVGITVHR